MSSKIFTMTATSIALIAGLGTSAFAQDNAQSVELPGVLQALELTDVDVKKGPRGAQKIEGDLPGGGEIEAILDKENNVLMIRGDDAALPQSVLDEMLPQAVRDNDILSQFAVIDQVGGREGRAMVGGQDADGEELRAGFDADGRLMRFGRGDEDHAGKRGDRHHRDEGRGDHHRGGKGHGMDKRGDMHGKRGDHGPEGRPGPDGRPGPEARHGDDRPMPRIDVDAIGEKLNDAGYTEIGKPRPAGPRIEMEATNPAGETVILEVDRNGEVLRELAR
ncbi:hypothetical protein [Paracoccus seriniphilus]|uniref:Peptidase propeptide and YPEB domain-containing protein n=1 Tax=Paracoccus seriniphilus TaxID=184748 RepID=A0A239PMU4_9RHOB|nr:hypothetical protein [Paracoccus seriniphilus]WCR14935.1 hypothetical protein JHW44_05750 [Paracoccus seriniphilus]SNT71641.1 hypothetical protein SAMN05444959_102151 [Paracoccus seriniphilus]